MRRITKRIPDPRELLKDLSGPLHNKDFWIIRKSLWLVWFVWAFKFSLAIITLLITSFFGFSAFVYYYTGNLTDDSGRPLDFSKLDSRDYRQSSYIYPYDSDQPIGRFFYEIRDPIKYEEIPDLLKNAFIAAEDQRFNSWIQYGIDPLATSRAAGIAIIHAFGLNYGKKQGASGVPQQLARTLFADEVKLFRNRTPTYWRKIFEAQVAIQLVKRYPKTKLLESLMNRVYFGHGINGISEAARYYLGKDIRKDKLTPQDVAILVGLNKSASVYCPIFHEPAKPQFESGITEEKMTEALKEYEKQKIQEGIRLHLAKDRANWVLERMWKNDYINEAEMRSALFKKDEIQAEAVHITPLKNKDFGYGNRLVKEMLLFMGYRDEDLTSYGGFKITTSFDSRIQMIASEEFNKHLSLINSEIPENEERLEGAFVIIDNKTGRISALSGGHSFDETQYNRTLASRSPGSAAKPLTYAAAFEYAGKTLSDQICNCPFRMRGANGKTWAPQNFREDNPVSQGYIPLPIGLIRSVNLATLNLARSIGMEPIINTAHDLGIWGNTRTVRDSDGNIWFKQPGQELEGGLVPLLPTAIGASDVNLLELTNAYAAFARGGIYMKPTLLTQIKDSEGKTIFNAGKPEQKRALSQETANKIMILMRAVTKVGTAKISMRDIKQQVACKTGTSNGPRDLLLVCYTPEITMGIRMGYDSNKIIALPQYLKKVSGASNLQISGGWVVGPLFRKIIDRIYEDRQAVDFPPEIEQGLEELLASYPARYK